MFIMEDQIYLMYSHLHSRSGFLRHSKLKTVSRIALQDFPTLSASWPFNGATDVMALALDEQSAGQCWGATVLSTTLKLSCFIYVSIFQLPIPYNHALNYVIISPV